MVISNVMFGFHGEIGGIRWRKTMSDGNQNSGDHSSVEGKVVEIYHYLWRVFYTSKRWLALGFQICYFRWELGEKLWHEAAEILTCFKIESLLHDWLYKVNLMSDQSFLDVEKTSNDTHWIVTPLPQTYPPQK